jgi:hypothetical protein
MHRFTISFREVVLTTTQWLGSNKRGLCSVMLLWFCVLTPDACFSYPHKPEKDFFFVQERSQLVWPEGDRKFALYDNFSYPLEPNSQLPFITPYTKEFVPADIIPANLPVNDFFRKNLMVEDQIANLLYANLRMKKLLEEYYQVQESAYALFHNMEKFGTYYYDTAGGILNSSSLSKTDTNPESSNNTNLVTELKKWMNKSNSDKALARSAKSYIDNSQKLDNGERGSGSGPLALSSSHKKDSATEDKKSSLTIYQSRDIGQITGLPDFRKPSYQSTRVSRNQEQTHPREEKQEEERHYRYAGDSSKPWIEVLAIKTIQYFKENKGEALFFLFLIFIPIFLVTSSKSR